MKASAASRSAPPRRWTCAWIRRAASRAADLLATRDERELADLIYEYGEERKSRRIAHAIVALREAGTPVRDTADLAGVVARAVRAPAHQRIHPATRTFQALRIAVNDELGALRDGLDAALARTATGGRIAVISFHSLEDRIVKHTFREDPRVRAMTRKPVVADGRRSGVQPARAQRQAARRRAHRGGSVINAQRIAAQPQPAAPELRRIDRVRHATKRRARRTRRRMHRPALRRRHAGDRGARAAAGLRHAHREHHLAQLRAGACVARPRRNCSNDSQRLDDRIARLQSPERLAALAAALKLHDPHVYAVVRVPEPKAQPQAHGPGVLRHVVQRRGRY